MGKKHKASKRQSKERRDMTKITTTALNTVLDSKAQGIPFTKNHTTTTYKILTSIFQGFKKVLISERAYYKMLEYTKHCNMEISWLGTVVERGEGVVEIDDVYLFEQECSAATTEIDETAIVKFATDLLENPPEGVDPVDVINRLRVWGHSHVNMATNPSGRDDETMNEFGDGVLNTGYPYMIRIITNKSGSLKLDVYHYDLGVGVFDQAWELDTPRPTIAGIREEVLAKVKTRSTVHYGQHQNWQPQHGTPSGNTVEKKDTGCTGNDVAGGQSEIDEWLKSYSCD